MRRALVLNASFEPLSVVSARRAIVLVLGDKADTVVSSGAWFRSERLRVEAPSVVRLRRYVKVPYVRRAALNRRGVFARDGGRCQYCGAKADSIDHVIPRSKGGPHAWENVVAACRPCNVSKRDRLLEDTSMRLVSPPRSPVGAAWVTVAVGSVPDEWWPYLGVDAGTDGRGSGDLGESLTA